jgi:hypothetical protein
MGSLSNFAENALLSHLCTAAITPAATLYVALCTADPGETATAVTNEVTVANGYARTAVTFGAAASRRVVQSGAVTFPQATGSWGTITHWNIVSTASGAGDSYAYGNFVSSFAPVALNTPTIPSTELEVEISATAGGAGFSDYLVHNWLNRLFRNQAFPKPATYVGLATSIIADATAIGGITEVGAGLGYARVLVNVTGGAAPAWTTVANGAVENTGIIPFGTPTGAGWGTIVSMFLVDSITAGAGNILGYDNANITDQTVVAGDTVQFATGALDLTLS